MQYWTEQEWQAYRHAEAEIKRCQMAGSYNAHPRVFQLKGKHLKAIPDSIGRLSGLEALFITGAEIARLPHTMVNLKELRLLQLVDCGLRELPTWIGKLSKLQLLNVSKNNLTFLPEAIGEIKGLQQLVASCNNLQSLPDCLRKMESLRLIMLHDNSLLQIPADVLGPRWELVVKGGPNFANAEPILDFYFAGRTQGNRALDETRIVLVGRGGSGKTSLVQQLVHKSFNPSEKETPGIALSDWKLARCEGGPVTAHLWDFAGQVITHSMHRYFLSARTLYILVLTQREDMAMDDADYWLKLIQSYGADGKDSADGPPVLVALNKSDQARVKVDRNALRERFPFIVDFVETDCATSRGIEDLRKSLCALIDTPKVREWVRMPYPANWWKVKAAIEDEQRTNPHISYDAWRQLCTRCGINDPKEQDSISANLHTLGVALNYAKDDRLRDNTVLRPNWVTHHCYNLIRHAAAHKGELWRAELDSVLRPERGGVAGEPDPTMQLYLMRLMERFEMAYPLGEEWPPERWLVPLGLPDNQPDGVEKFGRMPPEDVVRLRYAYSSVPPGLMAQFIVRTHGMMESEKQWASGTVLALNGARALVRATSKTEVEVTVSGTDREARRDLAGLCREELRELHAQIAGLDVVETTEVVAEGQRVWVKVLALEKDEQKGEPRSGILTDEGTVFVDPRKELDEFGTGDSRLPQTQRFLGGPPREGPGFHAFAKSLPRLFISYSHQDERLRKAFEPYLKILKIQGLADSAWHDRRILPGADWHTEITTELSRAHVVLFLVSTASLTSDYIQGVEFAEAIKRRQEGETEVVFIVLEPCDWIDTLAALPPFNAHPEPKRQLPQAIPRDNRPVRSFSPQSAGWHEVAEELNKLLIQVKERINHPDY